MTFHVTFAFVHDERVASPASLFIAHNAYAFNGPVRLKFTADVALRCTLVL